MPLAGERSLRGRCVRVSLALGMLGLGVLGAFDAEAASARVLLVGTYKGVPGSYTSIQAADWVLVGPGDYHEQADHRADRGPQPADQPAGVVIGTPDIHLRGMDRNG